MLSWVCYQRVGRGATPTSLRAEAVLLVTVIVLGGATPAVAVRAALRGAAVVRRALEAERELAGLSVSVAAHGEQGWGAGERGRVHSNVSIRWAPVWMQSWLPTCPLTPGKS